MAAAHGDLHRPLTFGSAGPGDDLAATEAAVASPLYRRRTDPARVRALLTVAASLAAAMALAGLAAWLATGHSAGPLGPGRWLDVAALALLAGLGPPGLLAAARARRERELEARLPDLLRDLAASRRAGLTLPAAVEAAAETDYGPLAPEVRRMADQLRWNVPFDEALARFAARVDTPLARRTASLVREAGRSGGRVADVLVAAARDARELHQLHERRRGTMALYAGVIHVTFLVFLGVAAVLYGTFLPEALRGAEALAAGGAPGIAGLGAGGAGLADYRQLYFLAALVQAVGNGLVAGLVGSGRARDGLRHAALMVAVALAAFALVLPLPPG